ncbi:hypothetical protein BCR33DRAFT_856129 [Rhizoclosmatium globosum]|uniref:Uncharacterized protein n=1 Tax=Rhizoclosmatium globosum TaxID=329046 RepID=A0A1Y2BGA5_9FUNG|nr:hypothetical protein BCR33DRAFT_856129 [Rhizoclosmatium globosum]|eukprot:ORY33851.1 hypothetical protein BCR33DRAFT_856129 [Rhizoclosmatium globosum]
MFGQHAVKLVEYVLPKNVQSPSHKHPQYFFQIIFMVTTGLYAVTVALAVPGLGPLLVPGPASPAVRVPEAVADIDYAEEIDPTSTSGISCYSIDVAV